MLNYAAAYAGEALVQGGAEEEWVVIVNAGVSDEQIKDMCHSAKNGCKLSGNPSKGGVPFLEMRGTEKDLEAVIDRAHGAVKYIEPDQRVYAIPEMEASDANAGPWGLERVGASARSSQGAGVSVFITDTGVRASHQDFGGRVIPALDMTSGSLVECNGDTGCAQDKQGHGTHCAGSAAGATFGVAPAATIRSVKVLSDQGSGSWSWSYGALDWLATSNIRPAIASMSLGGQGTQQAMADAVESTTNAGVTVVVAGGNSNSDSCGFSPAFVPSAITVGSTDSRDRRSSFSNYGSCTNIWAPGSDVKSAGHRSDDGTATMSGTSMACPHVAGGAALVLEGNPTMKPSAVLDALLSNAAKDYLTDLKTGDTNALLFVGEGGAPPAPPTPAPTTPAPTPPGTGCDPATSTGPDYDGDCRCNSGLSCYEGGNRGCTYSYTASSGYTSSRWFLPSCGGCECRR